MGNGDSKATIGVGDRQNFPVSAYLLTRSLV